MTTESTRRSPSWAHDGNGRTGRTLVHAILKEKGVTTRLTVPVSAGLLTDTRSYFDALTAYREGNPNPIVERFANAYFDAVNNGRALVKDLRTIYEIWRSNLGARADAAAWRVLPLLLRQPAITVKSLESELSITSSTAARAVEQLVGSAVLAPASVNRRNRVFLASDVLLALDDFARRVGRRS